MRIESAISGVVTFDLDQIGNRQILLRESDQLLRRFGQLEIITISNESKAAYRRRSSADEFIYTLMGQLSFHLIDIRQGSPTRGAELDVDLKEGLTQALLIPFGVAYSIAANGEAKLIRLSTERDEINTADDGLSYEQVREMQAGNG